MEGLLSSVDSLVLLRFSHLFCGKRFYSTPTPHNPMSESYADTTIGMTKDLSRRSSVAGSSHAPSPRENGAQTPPQEPRQSGDTSSNVSRSISLHGDLSKATQDPELPPPPESQSMVASNSTSSTPSALDMSAGIAAPYGTRSRNRNGTSRPNYAEDKDLDTEFEVTVAPKDSNGRNKPARGADPSPPANLDHGRAPNTSRKNTSSESDNLGTIQNHYKEPIPGTSTFSANPASGATSKKRKAAAQASAATGLESQHQMPIHVLSAPQAVTRKASTATQVTTGLNDSNMLSFDGCGARLKAKKLVADDGTVLEVNGG